MRREEKIGRATAVRVERNGRVVNIMAAKSTGRKAWLWDKTIYHGRGTSGAVRVPPDTLLDLRTGDVYRLIITTDDVQMREPSPAGSHDRDVRIYRGYFVLYEALGKKYEIYREEDGKPGRFEQYAESKHHARRIIDAIHGD